MCLKLIFILGYVVVGHGHTQGYHPHPVYGVPFGPIGHPIGTSSGPIGHQPNILDIRKHTHSHSEHTITKEIGIPIEKVVHVPKPYPVDRVVHVKVPVYVQVPSASGSTLPTWNPSATSSTLGVDQLRPPSQGYLPVVGVQNQNNHWNSYNPHPHPNVWQNPPFKVPLNTNTNHGLGFGQHLHGGYTPSIQGGLSGYQGYNTHSSGWKW